MAATEQAESESSGTRGERGEVGHAQDERDRQTERVGYGSAGENVLKVIEA